MTKSNSMQAEFQALALGQTLECPSCQIAETSPRTGHYHTGCKECSARALAQSPESWKALHAQTAVPLQDAIERVFGVDGRDEGRRMVWAWIKRLRSTR